MWSCWGSVRRFVLSRHRAHGSNLLIYWDCSVLVLSIICTAYPLCVVGGLELIQANTGQRSGTSWYGDNGPVTSVLTCVCLDCERSSGEEPTRAQTEHGSSGQDSASRDVSHLVCFRASDSSVQSEPEHQVWRFLRAVEELWVWIKDPEHESHDTTEQTREAGFGSQVKKLWVWVSLPFKGEDQSANSSHLSWLTPLTPPHPSPPPPQSHIETSCSVWAAPDDRGLSQWKWIRITGSLYMVVHVHQLFDRISPSLVLSPPTPTPPPLLLSEALGYWILKCFCMVLIFAFTSEQLRQPGLVSVCRCVHVLLHSAYCFLRLSFSHTLCGPVLNSLTELWRQRTFPSVCLLKTSMNQVFKERMSCRNNQSERNL